jgi:hypothetical protein
MKLGPWSRRIDSCILWFGLSCIHRTAQAMEQAEEEELEVDPELEVGVMTLACCVLISRPFLHVFPIAIAHLADHYCTCFQLQLNLLCQLICHTPKQANGSCKDCVGMHANCI